MLTLFLIHSCLIIIVLIKTIISLQQIKQAVEHAGAFQQFICLTLNTVHRAFVKVILKKTNMLTFQFKHLPLFSEIGVKNIKKKKYADMEVSSLTQQMITRLKPLIISIEQFQNLRTVLFQNQYAHMLKHKARTLTSNAITFRTQLRIIQ